MKVLIVDDEPYMSEYIRKLVDWESYGFTEVLIAKGGSVARDILHEKKPELLITDIKMPKITGIDLAKMIYESNYQTKVIIISGYSEFEHAKEAIRYKVSEYLVKPVVKVDFIETLERVLQNDFNFQVKRSDTYHENLSNHEEIVGNVKTYVQNNYSKNLSLDVLGEYVHLHPSYLSKIFKEVTGINISSFVTEVKMIKTAELIELTELRIHEVMEKMGYHKSQHFSKLFKEKYGMTPNEYRRCIRNRQQLSK